MLLCLCGLQTQTGLILHNLSATEHILPIISSAATWKQFLQSDNGGSMFLRNTSINCITMRSQNPKSHSLHVTTYFFTWVIMVAVPLMPDCTEHLDLASHSKFQTHSSAVDEWLLYLYPPSLKLPPSVLKQVPTLGSLNHIPSNLP